MHTICKQLSMMHKQLSLLLVIFTLLLSGSSALAAGAALVYPELSDPTRNPYNEIITGVLQGSNNTIASIAFKENGDLSDLNGALRRQDVKIVITLGRYGTKIMPQLDSGINILASGIIHPPSDMRNFRLKSLAPEPSVMFNKLKKLMPNAKRVFIVYDPKQNDWFMRMVKEAAKQQPWLDLRTFEVNDLRAAVQNYKEILSNFNNKQDVIWLLQDTTTVEDTAVMPLLLQESWLRGLAIISNNPSHVKRGALFSATPDPREIANYMVSGVKSYLANNNLSGIPPITPMKDIILSVNVRTAKHLDLEPNNLENYRAVITEQ